jgi:hypothetical protein
MNGDDFASLAGYRTPQEGAEIKQIEVASKGATSIEPK